MTKSKRGGPRPGAGRPTIGQEARNTHHVTIEPVDAEYLKVQGKGNLSGGIAKVVKEHKKGRSK